jgi:hypothetical protein
LVGALSAIKKLFGEIDGKAGEEQGAGFGEYRERVEVEVKEV